MIEELIIAQNEAKDTLLHFSYYFSRNESGLKLAPGLDLAVDFIETKQDGGSSYNLIYAGMEKGNRQDTFTVVKNNRGLSYANHEPGLATASRYDASMLFIQNGRVRHELVYTHITDDTRMKKVLKMFAEQLENVMENTSCVKYISRTGDEKKLLTIEKTWCY